MNGIVDRSVKKNLSLSVAAERGIAAVRLPIREHMPGVVSPVLNVNTMMEIFCRYKETDGDWGAVLQLALPQRKKLTKKEVRTPPPPPGGERNKNA